MELTARIHIEEGSYWADVPELPGCFASGDTLDELFESLQEGVADGSAAHSCLAFSLADLAESCNAIGP
jgi:hypothetical protein